MSENQAIPKMSSEAKKSSMIMALLYLVAIALGVLNGLYGTQLFQDIAQFLSTVFVRLFKFISVPIIAVSIITTLSRISQNSATGRIFRHTITYTLLTTILAATLAAGLYLLFAPQNVTVNAAASIDNITQTGYLDYLKTVIPDNILSPFLSANVLSVLLIAAAIGIAIAKLPQGGRHQEILMTFFSAIQSVLFLLVKALIKVLPIGIFGFTTVLVLDLKPGVALGGLGTYFITILSANIIQMFIILPLFLIFRGINPIKVFKAMSPALMVAFFSKSSAGTLPVTMNCAESRLGVSSSVARFTLPMCTTINMNGCAAFILVTVVYVMQNAGVEVTPSMLGTWIFIATLAAIGNAGVPMGCFFMSASILATMNVPLVLMGVILPFYAVIDMVETTLNVWSDCTVAAAVEKDIHGDEHKTPQEVTA